MTDQPRELVVDDVTCRFDGEPAVRDLSLSVRAGEHVALVGASGAGKTTLLRLAAGSIRPDSGSVTLDGRPVRAGDAALAYQGDTLLGRRSALANVLSGRTGDLSWWRGLLEPLAPRDPDPALELLEAVGLRGKSGKRADALSAGERQRVAFARALIQDAPIVLADEPTANLDPRSRATVLDVLDELVGDRLLVTALHDVDLALERFDRIVGLADGRLHFDRPAAEVSTEVLDDLFEAGTAADGHDHAATSEADQPSPEGRWYA